MNDQKQRQNKIFHQIRAKKGASSVLVILIMVVLVSIGLGALTTSLASMRLGEKSGEWYVEYYEMDTLAEKTLAIIDSTIKTSRKDSNDNTEYFDNILMELKNTGIDTVTSEINTDDLILGYRIKGTRSSDVSIKVTIQINGKDEEKRFRVIEWTQHND